MQIGFTPWDLGGALPDAWIMLAMLAMAVAAAAVWRGRLQSRHLSQQASRLRALAGTSFDGLILARAGAIIEVNPALARLMGVGTAWFDHRPLSAVLDVGAQAHHAGPAEGMLILPDG